MSTTHRTTAADAAATTAAATTESTDNGVDNGASASTADAAEAGKLAALEAERTKRQAVEKELAELRAEREAAARAAAEEAGKFKELYEQDKEAHDATRAELEEFRGRETARLERVTANNDKRTKALPAAYRALVPEGLAADAVAEHLGRLEAIVSKGERPDGTRARGSASVGDVPAEAKAEAVKHYTQDRRSRYSEDEWVRFYHDSVWNSPKRKAARERSTR